MRLLCVLNGGPDHPSTRFRLVQHLDLLRRRDLDPDLFVAKGAKGSSRYNPIQLWARARDADAVLIQKKLFARWKLALLPRRAPVIFDFDDALFETSPLEEERYGPDRAADRTGARRGRLAAILRRASLVLAGNRFLADYARRHSSQVEVLPTGIDLAAYPQEQVARAAAEREAPGRERIIGWIGSSASLRYLLPLAAPLAEVLRKAPGTRVVLVCDEFVDLPGVAMEKRLWSAEREVADLLGFDVGLMPLDDRPFSQGKCGFKILQYQAAGIPVVCSPVGANLEIVTGAETGLFARGGPEWVEAILRLLEDRSLARRLAARGRDRMAAVYSAAIIGARLAERILATARPRARERGSAQRGASINFLD